MISFPDDLGSAVTTEPWNWRQSRSLVLPVQWGKRPWVITEVHLRSRSHLEQKASWVGLAIPSSFCSEIPFSWGLPSRRSVFYHWEMACRAPATGVAWAWVLCVWYRQTACERKSLGSIFADILDSPRHHTADFPINTSSLWVCLYGTESYVTYCVLGF